MIIDSHCHVGEFPHHFPESFAADMMNSIGQPAAAITVHIPQLLADLDAAGIDKVFILAFDAYRTLGAKVPDEYVTNLCRAHPDRFIGFCSVDGMAPSAAQAVRHAILDLRLQGIKIAPAYLHLSPSDPCWYGVYEVAQELAVPILVHTGFTPAKQAGKQYMSPMLMSKAASDFPSLRFILAHMGTPWVTQCIDLLAKHANLYADLSIFGWYQPIERVAQTLSHARKCGVLNRVLWGTDFPWGPHRGFRERMDQLRQDAMLFPDQQALTEQEWSQIMGATALQLVRPEA